MKTIKHQRTYISNEEVIEMESLQVQYEERDVNLEEVKKIAMISSQRIQKERDERLKSAINNHDSYYIRRELENISTYDLLRMIISKII